MRLSAGWAIELAAQTVMKKGGIKRSVTLRRASHHRHCGGSISAPICRLIPGASRSTRTHRAARKRAESADLSPGQARGLIGDGNPIRCAVQGLRQGGTGQIRTVIFVAQMGDGQMFEGGGVDIGQ